MRLYTVTGLITALLVSGCAVTQPPKAEEDHSALHPEANAAPATAGIPAAPMPTPAPEAFNRQLQAMKAMHQKMQAAKTPAKRAALMDEQMKLMQSGMAMMGQMRGAAPAGAEGIPAMGDMMGMDMGMHLQMERRMAMTEQMMQMMMDRLPAPAPAGAKRPKIPK